MWPVINSIPLIGWNYSIQPVTALEFIPGHVVYKRAYNQILQTKETKALLNNVSSVVEF